MGWAYLDAAREAEPNRAWAFSHAGYRALIAAAPQPQPQPPALSGELVKRYVLDATNGRRPEMAEDQDGFYCAYEHVAPLLAEIERLRGMQPDFPPRPPEGSGLPRFGLRWNGPQQPLAVPMSDGYWTPWHLADGAHNQLAELISAVRSINHGPRHAHQLPGDNEPVYPQHKEWVEWILDMCNEAEATLKISAPQS